MPEEEKTCNCVCNCMTPNIKVVVVMDEDSLTKVVSKIPDSIIVNKVINHVKKTGSSGLAGKIAKELNSY